MTSTPFLAARKAHAAGMSVIPIRADGTKRPDLDAWKSYQEQRASLIEVRQWFNATNAGLAVVGGEVSGGLEVLDFDRPDLWAAFKSRAVSAGIETLVRRVADGYSERSPNGSHLLYRVAESRTQKLAKADARTTLIETRGEGGYCIVAPSNGSVHPSGEPYELISGDFANVVTLADDEHESLLDLARSFDECQPQTASERAENQAPNDAGNRIRPGDDFGARATWEEILEPHGWRFIYSQGDASYWRRPGKDLGISASTEKFPGMFLVFTSSTEFESTLEAKKGYTKFAAFTLLNHGGDFSAAARDLAAQGYGEKGPRPGSVLDADSPEHLTDLGNAERLVRLHGRNLRHVHKFARWLVWDGKRWLEDTGGELVRRAKDVPKDLYREASEATTEGVSQALAKHAVRSEAEPRINAMISLARAEAGIPAKPDDFDADGRTLNTPKGLVDLHSGEMTPHRRDALCSKMTGAGFESGARSSLWESCLETWLPDPDVRSFVKRAVGYSLIGEILEEVLLIVWGSGGNGKTVFFETIRLALGDYATQTPAETIIAQRATGIPNDVARLKGARFVSASESDENRKLAESKVKSLTGGDMITARFMRGEWFEFSPTFTVWLSTNHKPIVTGADLGIWRRIRLIPFDVEIPEHEREGSLLGRLHQELPAVLAWAIEGCLEYQEQGLAAPDAVMHATDSYRREQDALGIFIDERCVKDPARFATTQGLYRAFCEWAKSSGEEPCTKRAFSSRICERGFDKHRTAGQRGFVGIALAAMTNDAS